MYKVPIGAGPWLGSWAGAREDLDVKSTRYAHIGRPAGRPGQQSRGALAQWGEALIGALAEGCAVWIWTIVPRLRLPCMWDTTTEQVQPSDVR